MKFSELQQQLKERFGIDHLADIARELGVSPQAVSNWKARDRVPYKYVLKIRQQFEESNNQVSDQSENDAPDSNQVFHQYGYPQYFDEDTISLTDIILALARHLKIIIIMPTIFCTLTIFYVLFIAQPLYESRAKIMSSSGSRVVSQNAGIAAQFGISLPTGQSELDWIYPDIIKSRTLARAMLKRKFDTEKFGLQKPLLQILTFGDKQPNFGRDTLEIMAVNNLLEMIKVSEDRNKVIYTVSMYASEPKLAFELNKVLIEELDRHQREYNKAKTSEARQFIEERIVDTEKELNATEEALKNFRDRNRRIQNSPSLQLEEQRLFREVTVLTGVFTTLKQQLETAKIEDVKDMDFVIVLDPPEIALMRSEPKRRQMVILAGFLGLILGTILGFVREYTGKSTNEEREKISKAKILFRKNVLALIPRRSK
jgi:uncharacterized protein involved in exopolysaccharide biosynthesis